MLDAFAHFVAGWLVTVASLMYVRLRDTSDCPVDMPALTLLALSLAPYGPMATVFLLLRL